MTRRFIVFDRQLRPLFDLDGRVTEAMRYERINGEHKLDVKTTQPLEEGMRILVRDGTLTWREWVIDEPDEHKEGTDVVEGAYGCTWSVQYDLSRVSGGELWPGTYEPITAGAALAMVLAAQSRWEVGHVTVATMAGTSLFDGQVWDYLGKLREVWGGEIEPRIEVDSDGVTHRYVDWLAHVGSEDATRRFDYGEDCTRIDRKPPVGPMCCRIVPRGGKDATDNDGVSYSERVGVEEEPYSEGDGWVHDANSIWVRDPDAEALFRTPNPDGTWHYPELVVTYDTDDPEELLQLASADIHKHTRPSPTYEADVLQFAAAGMDAHGVALGDVVHVVDRKFGDAPLRIEARIVEMTVNELDDTDVRLVIGEATRGIESAFKSMRSAIDEAEGRVRRIEGDTTIVRLETLLEQINAEINGTGGYSYLVPGEGIITYDRRVADPLVGTEASYVTQMKGGVVRFAKSKKPAFAGINDWNWTNVITADGYLGLAATIGAITTGFIGSAGDTYIDLDNHTAQLGQTSGPHMGIDASGMQIYDGSDSLGFFGTDAGTSIARIGQESYGNVVMSSEGYVRIRDGSNTIAHFGNAEYTHESQFVSGPYYTLGTRVGEAGANSIVGGVDNFAGPSCRYSSAFGVGLVAPSYENPGGMAIGRYNCVDYPSSESNKRAAGQLISGYRPVFVVGNGTSDSNRSNALEVSSGGSLGIAGNLYAQNVGTVKEVSVSSATPGSGSTYNTVGSVTITTGTWMVFVNMSFSGLVTSSASTEARVYASTRTGTSICRCATSKSYVSASGVYKAGSSSNKIIDLGAGYSSGTGGSVTCSGTLKAVQIA